MAVASWRRIRWDRDEGAGSAYRPGERTMGSSRSGNGGHRFSRANMTTRRPQHREPARSDSTTRTAYCTSSGILQRRPPRSSCWPATVTRSTWTRCSLLLLSASGLQSERHRYARAGSETSRMPRCSPVSSPKAGPRLCRPPNGNCITQRAGSGSPDAGPASEVA